MGISVILVGAITTVVITSTQLVGKQQLNAVESAQANTVLYSYGNTTREADTIKKGATGSSLILNLRTGNRCERHEYRFVADTRHSGRLALEHLITAVVLPGNLGCKSVDKTLSAGVIAPQTQRTLASYDDAICLDKTSVNARKCGPELDNLGTGSRFVYYNTQGRITPRIGDSGYLNNVIQECKIGSVAMVLMVPSLVGQGSQDAVMRSQVAIMNNQRGLSTCEA